MPLRVPQILSQEMSCGTPYCTESASVIVLDCEGHRIGSACPRHAEGLIDGVLSASGRDGVCVACGEQSSDCVLIDDGEWSGVLCRGQAAAYLSFSLSPEAFEKIVADAGGDPERVGALDSDFYADARAWNPIPLGELLATEYIEQMQELPGYDSSGALDLRDGDVVALLQLMQEGYRAKTGIDLHREVAMEMLAYLVAQECILREKRSA